jgi:hypothetical protein
VWACGSQEQVAEEEAAYRRALLQDDELDAAEDGESSSAQMEAMQVRPAARHEIFAFCMVFSPLVSVWRRV